MTRKQDNADMLTHICIPRPWVAESGESQDRCFSQHEILYESRAIKNKKKMFLFYHMTKLMFQKDTCSCTPQIWQRSRIAKFHRVWKQSDIVRSWALGSGNDCPVEKVQSQNCLVDAGNRAATSFGRTRHSWLPTARQQGWMIGNKW